MSYPPPPESISVRPDWLVLRWPDGACTSLSASALRAACRCAYCRMSAKHGAGLPASPAGLEGATPVGQYALQLTFSDGHSRGIYPWALLRDLAEVGGTK